MPFSIRHLDFDSTSFSHAKSGDLSLSNPNQEIRDFWIEHTKRCRAVAEEMGRRQGDPCIMNLWVHDGSKDITVNITEYVDDEMRAMPAISEVYQIGAVLPHLKNCYFYCKGTNMRMCDLARRPMDLGIYHFRGLNGKRNPPWRERGHTLQD